MRQGHRLNNRYRLDERVAAGGMGEVWRGHDTRLKRTVAIKILHDALAGDEVFQQRFQVEARAIAALQHPGVVNVFDFGDDVGEDGETIAFLIMEYVEGRSLQQVLTDQGKLSPDETLRIIAETAEALDVAHRAQIIHRDVKPGNILIDASGAPRLVDFGIARTEGAAGLTNTGMVMGTAAYVAPEQLRGDDPTPATDVYALGVVAYKCLTGRTPFDSDIPATLIAAALNDDPPPLTGFPEPVAAIVMRALAKDPAARWDSAAELAAACRSPADADITPLGLMRESAPTADDLPRAKPRGRAARFAIAALITLLLMALTGVVTYLRPWEDAQTAQADSDDHTELYSPVDEPSTSAASTTPGKETETSSADEPVDPATTPDTENDDPTSPDGESAVLDNFTDAKEEDAYNAVQAAGFTNYSSEYYGSGDFYCRIDDQKPPPGYQYPLDTEIVFYVEQVEDMNDCANQPG